MLTPTEGSCRVLGLDPSGEPEKVHARMGVVTEHAQMYDELTGMENLVFYGAVFGIPAGEAGGGRTPCWSGWSWGRPGTGSWPPTPPVCASGSPWPGR